MHADTVDRTWARRAVLVLGVAVAAVFLAGCHGGPHTDLDVTTTVDGRDAVPGDGTCEVTPGAGDCSLRAAVDEANATSGPTPAIRVPGGTYELTLPGVDDTNAGGDLDLAPLSGFAEIEAVGGDVVIDAAGATTALDVRSGTVFATGVAVRGASGPGATVRGGGQLLFWFGTSHGNGGAGLRVDPGGTLRLLDATVSSNTGAGVDTAGALDAISATITANGAGGITGPGTIALETTAIGDQTAGVNCSHAVVTRGGNLADDTTCGLGAGDEPVVDSLRLGPLTGAPVPRHLPAAGSPALDALPAGTGRCGGSGAIAIDQVGTPRPQGTGCEIGAVEVDPTIDLVVDTAADAPDTDPGDGDCTTAAGACSLRAAVDEAEAQGGADTRTITLAADPVLGLAGADDTNATGDLDIHVDLAIDGAGHTIDAAGIDRALDVHAGTVTITDTVLAGGTTADAGGAALVHADATLTLDDVEATGNDAAEGGAIAAVGTTLAVCPPDGCHWPVFPTFEQHPATLVVTGSRIAGNRAGAGGGILGRAADVDVSTTTVEGNVATSGKGGGILRAGTSFAVPEFTIGTLEIDRSTIAGNEAAGTGGGVGYDLPGTPLAFPPAATTVRRSTVAANRAASAAGVDGPSSLVLATLTGNLGLTSLGSPADLRGSVVDAPVAACTGVATSGGYNVVSDASCALGATGDVTAPAILGGLAANGGTTETVLPAASSPAVDRIPAGTPGLCDAGTATDQRGVSRPAGPACDSGAVEGTGPAPAPLALVVTSAADARDADPGDGTCAAVGGGCTLRAAIDEANLRATADTVTIAAGVNPLLSLAGAGEDANRTGDLDVLGTLTLVGGGAKVDGAQLDRVVHQIGGRLELRDVVITRGRLTGTSTTSGAGVFQGPAAGDLDLLRTSIHGNVAVDAVDGAGLGLTHGTVTISRSTISSNGITGTTLAAAGTGAGIHNAGAALVVDRTTFTSNTGVNGGAIYGSSPATATVTASTFARNVGRATIWGTAPVTLRASVITPYVGTACTGVVTSGGYNVVGDATCSLTAVGDRLGVDPMLGRLGAHGGTTTNHVPSVGSPAVDVIPAGTVGLCDASLPTDQRGVARPAGGACDAGSVEGTEVAPAPLSLVVDAANDARDATPGNGLCNATGGGCTLRAAIDEANISPTNDTITIAAGIDPVLSRAGRDDDVNSTGDLDISGSLTIDGDGATIDAAQLDRVVDLQYGHLTVREVTATGGLAMTYGGQGGAGIRQRPGGTVLDVVDATIRGNTTQDRDNDGAGVLVAGGTATIDRSTISGNDASDPDASGGGVAVTAGASLTIRNSTITGNHAGWVAAAVRSAGTVALVHTTVADNTGPSTFTGTGITLTASAVTGGGAPVCTSTLASGGRNVVADTSCGLGGPGDLSGTNPILEPLADNGGPTHTRRVSAGSAALDRVPVGTAGLCDGTVPVDQRGVARPSGAGCDAGAVEGAGAAAPPLTLVVTTAADLPDVTPGDRTCLTSAGTCSLRAAITESNAAGTPDTITIAPGIDPVLTRTGRFEDANSTGDLDVTDTTTIAGTGNDVDAAAIDRVIDHRLGDLTITGVDLRGGLATAGSGDLGRGGGLWNRDSAGNLTITGSTVSGNATYASDGDGGGIAANGATATILRSTIRDNATIVEFSDGGGLEVSGADGIVRASTVSGNTTNGSQANGSGIHLGTGSLQVTASTVAANVGRQALSAQYATATVRGSVVATTSGVACSGTVVSGGGNVGSDTTCPFTAGGDVRNVDPLLLGLADNGGPTATHLPAAGSPALDRVTTGTAGVCDTSLATDQRGVARPAGAACDSGAVEGVGPAASPLTLTVTTAADGRDSAPGDGVCNGGGGQCTLRAAIDEANHSPHDDTVVITAGVNPVLSLGGANEDRNARGDLDVNGTLTITGNGATVDAAGLDRVIHHRGGRLTLTNLTLRGGALAGANDLTTRGAGLRSAFTAGVALTNVTVTANTTVGTGGGVSLQSTSSPSTIAGTTVSANTTTTASGHGAGVALDAATTTLTTSTVSGNQILATGGDGAGISSSIGSLTLDRVTVSGNSGARRGGGLSSFSTTVTIGRSTISGNTAGQDGGGVTANYGTVTVDRSTISGNSAPTGAAVANAGPTTVTLTLSTLVSTGTGTTTSGALAVSGSVLANTTAPWSTCATAVSSSGYNREPGTSCGLGQVGDLASSNPLLGALAANGGTTLTHLPGVGSPLLDAIPTGTPGLCDATVAVDQRGSARPNGAGCDIGAVER